ncbi:MAG: hypothetical protein JW737_08845 [Acidobacteria bacterium]|nr:hypothetical protein [Acidobacteriota bacterium]
MKTIKLFGLFLILFLVACSGGEQGVTESSGSDSKPDNCSLVTEAEVADVLGKPVKQGGDSALGCAYIPEGETLSYFTVLVREKEGTPEDTYKNASSRVKVEKLAGVGDDGAMVISEGFVSDVVIFSGDWAIRFNVTFADIELGSKKFERFKSVMKKAISRL